MVVVMVQREVVAPLLPWCLGFLEEGDAVVVDLGPDLQMQFIIMSGQL